MCRGGGGGGGHNGDHISIVWGLIVFKSSFINCYTETVPKSKPLVYGAHAVSA